MFLFYFLAKDCQGRALHWPGKRESPVLTGGRGESRASHLETLSGDGETSAKRLGSKLWHISSAVDITFYSYSMLGNEGSASKSARVPSTTLLPPDPRGPTSRWLSHAGACSEQPRLCSRDTRGSVSKHPPRSTSVPVLMSGELRR